uniref:Uncharacterized protein n=1 Tax=Anguilla anguilla TaxID=7936 RepID=A0A0E9XL48_ANGAN
MMSKMSAIAKLAIEIKCGKQVSMNLFHPSGDRADTLTILT